MSKNHRKKICTLVFFATFLCSTFLFASHHTSECQEKTPLFDAVKKGNLKEVKRLVENGASPYAVCKYGRTLINIAAIGGHTHIIKYLVKLGVDYKKKVNCDCYKCDRTPAYFASKEGHLETLKYLIEKCKVDPNEVVSYCGDNLIHVAALEGHTHIIKYLIENLGVDCNKKNNICETVVYLAVSIGNLNTVKYLIEKCKVDPNRKADPNRVDCSDDNLIHVAARKGRTHIVKYFIENLGVDCNKKNKNGITPARIAVYFGKLNTVKYLIEKCKVGCFDDNLIHLAAREGHTHIIRYLIEKHKVDCNEKNEKGHTPVRIAIYFGRLDTVKYLIEKYKVDCFDDNLIHLAAREGQTHIIKYLIENLGVDCNKKNKNGLTPARIAVYFGKSDTVKYLIEKCKVDPNEVDCFDDNLIHVAAREGHPHIIRYLIEKHKVDCNEKNEKGHTPVWIAVYFGRLDTAKYLIEKCKVGCFDDNLIHLAAREGQTHIIKYLIENLGVDCNKNNKEGYTPVFFAVYFGKLDTVKYLIEKCKVDPNEVDCFGDNLIHVAARKGLVDIIKYLKNLGVNCDKKNKKGRTPAYFASSVRTLDALKYLIEECNGVPIEPYCFDTNLMYLALRSRNFPILNNFIYNIETAGSDFSKKAKCRDFILKKSYIQNATELDKVTKDLIKKRQEPREDYVISLFNKKETPALAKIRALNDLAKHKLLPKDAGKLFSKVLFGKVFLDHIYACHYALQNNNLKGCNNVTARQAIKRKKWAYEELSVRTTKQILLEEPRIIMMWPEFIPTILCNYGLYEKTKLRCLLGLEENLVESPKNKKTALKHLLKTKQLAKTTANNPNATDKDKRYSRQFGRSLNNDTMCLWELSKIVAPEVAAKTLTYASIE